VRVPVCGHELTIVWHPALDWLEAIRHDHRGLVLRLAEDTEDLVLGMADLSVPLSGVEKASMEFLEEETGRRWWIALKLAYSSAGESVLGELTLCGVDPGRVSFGQWCAAVYRILTRNCDDKERMKLDFELELPPPGYEESWDDGNDWSEFNALMDLAREQEGQR
jgi:hypothetical protein